MARLAPAGLGRFLGPKMEPEKHGFVEEWFRKWRLGDFPDPNGLYGTQEAFGRAHFPSNPTRKWFPKDFPNFGKIGEGPPGPLCISYWPFEGLAILSTDLVDPSLL